MARSRTITPPRPQHIRRPGRFGWLDDRLLRDDWLGRLGPEAVSVLVLLALAADRNGCSFYGRERMAAVLGLPRRNVDQALHRLLELGLVAHRPWQDGLVDGVWQILPMTPRPEHARRTRPAQDQDDARPPADAVSIGDVIRSLRLARQRVGLDPDLPSAPSQGRTSDRRNSAL